MAYTWALGLSSDRISSITDRTGDNSVIAASSLFIAICAAAAVAADASTSHRALETDAAAAIRAPMPGNVMQVADCRIG